jgi:hypothetical protein
MYLYKCIYLYKKIDIDIDIDIDTDTATDIDIDIDIFTLQNEFIYYMTRPHSSFKTGEDCLYRLYPENGVDEHPNVCLLLLSGDIGQEIAMKSSDRAQKMAILDSSHRPIC